MIVCLSVPYGLLKLQVDECNASASFYYAFYMYMQGIIVLGFPCLSAAAPARAVAPPMFPVPL
jgi:hypothetical protein